MDTPEEVEAEDSVWEAGDPVDIDLTAEEPEVEQDDPELVADDPVVVAPAAAESLAAATAKATGV